MHDIPIKLNPFEAIYGEHGDFLYAIKYINSIPYDGKETDPIYWPEYIPNYHNGYGAYRFAGKKATSWQDTFLAASSTLGYTLTPIQAAVFVPTYYTSTSILYNDIVGYSGKLMYYYHPTYGTKFLAFNDPIDNKMTSRPLWGEINVAVWVSPWGHAVEDPPDYAGLCYAVCNDKEQYFYSGSTGIPYALGGDFGDTDTNEYHLLYYGMWLGHLDSGAWAYHYTPYFTTPTATSIHNQPVPYQLARSIYHKINRKWRPWVYED
jgi:hypothetical protein